MCTAITYKTKKFYFGRTLDYEFAYPQEITITPRNFPLPFRDENTLNNHYSIIGMAYVLENYPLYFDAANEKGLAVAGLNFVGNAHYKEKESGKNNVAQFEFIPWILGRCANVNEAKKLIENTNITNKPFSDELPVAELHWLIADQNNAITVESVKEGLKVYDNPIGVLTNNPPFCYQMSRLNDYINLSNKSPENNFAGTLTLNIYSRGMGALGLPGDLSSASRFVRAAFVKLNSVSEETEISSVSQFFHILQTVNQPRGCSMVEDGKYEITIYTSCCNADEGIYYYTTYDNHSIKGIDMQKENLNGKKLIKYPLTNTEKIKIEN